MSTPSPLARTTWKELLLWLLGRRRRYQVVEQSMLPTLRPGDTILAQPILGRQSFSVSADDIVIAYHPTRSDLLLIKRVKETFYDGGCYLISDNLAEPTAQDSSSFGVVATAQIVARATSLLGPAP